MPEPTDLVARRWLVLASAATSFFAVGVGFFSVPPLIPLLAERFGLDNLRVGLLMGSIAVPAIVLSIPLGLAVDRWEARRAGLGGLAGMIAGAALFALGAGYPALVVGRIVFGVGGLVINLLQARLLARAFAGRELSLAMGVFLAAYPVSMIFCFTVLPELGAVAGWRGSLAVPALLAALALPLHAAAVPAGAGAVSRSGALRLRFGGPLVALGVAWCLFFAAYASLITFAPAWAGSTGLLVVSIVAWVSLFGGPLAGAVIDRTGGAHRWAAAGLAAFSVTFAAMAWRAAPPPVLMAAVGLVVAVVPTAIYSLPGRLVAPESVGFAFGLITSLSNLGTTIGPVVAGALRDRSPSWPLLWLAAAAVAAIAGLGALAARPPRP